MLLLLATVMIAGCTLIPDKLVDAISGSTLSFSKEGNSLFHQTEEISLKPGELFIAGEVKEPGMVNLKNHYKREVIIKESLFDSDKGIQFTGAYQIQRLLAVRSASLIQS
jgi:S-adenosylmethionine synthetase